MFSSSRLAIPLVPTVRQKEVVPLHKSVTAFPSVTHSGNSFGFAHKVFGAEEIKPPGVQAGVSHSEKYVRKTRRPMGPWRVSSCAGKLRGSPRRERIVSQLRAPLPHPNDDPDGAHRRNRWGPAGPCRRIPSVAPGVAPTRG